MKKTIIFGAAIALFALGAALTTKVVQNQMMIKDIEVMVKAEANQPVEKEELNDGSTGGGGMANKCCPIWRVTIEYSFFGGSIITCTTASKNDLKFKCEDCPCPN